MSNCIGVYGAAGCGRGILPLLREQFPKSCLVFIDDGMSPGNINGHDILDWHSFLKLPQNEKSVAIAISSPAVRQELADKCRFAGVPLVEARASNVVEMDDVEIGEGACLSPFVTLTSNIRIGRCFHANLYSYVEHDCVIGDFVTLAPAAKVHGNVVIGDGAYIGAGAMIRQGVRIGGAAVVGMGAVVVKDVPPNTTVVGNPAVVLRGGA